MRSIVFVPIVILMVVLQSGCNNLPDVPGNQPKVLTNSVGMKLVLIPKGTFMMGSPPDEIGSKEDERRHEVTISRDYHLGMHEVTQAQYKKIMGINPSNFQGDACNAFTEHGFRGKEREVMAVIGQILKSGKPESTEIQ